MNTRFPLLLAIVALTAAAPSSGTGFDPFYYPPEEAIVARPRKDAQVAARLTPRSSGRTCPEHGCAAGLPPESPPPRTSHSGGSPGRAGRVGEAFLQCSSDKWVTVGTNSPVAASTPPPFADSANAAAEHGSPWASATRYGAAVAQMPQASLPSFSALTAGQITTTDNSAAHDDVQSTTMIKTTVKPAREAQRRLTGVSGRSDAFFIGRSDVFLTAGLGTFSSSGSGTFFSGGSCSLFAAGSEAFFTAGPDAFFSDTFFIGGSGAFFTAGSDTFFNGGMGTLFSGGSGTLFAAGSEAFFGAGLDAFFSDAFFSGRLDAFFTAGLDTFSGGLGTLFIGGSGAFFTAGSDTFFSYPVWKSAQCQAMCQRANIPHRERGLTPTSPFVRGPASPFSPPAEELWPQKAIPQLISLIGRPWASHWEN